jgi:hypothetical protein
MKLVNSIKNRTLWAHSGQRRNSTGAGLLPLPRLELLTRQTPLVRRQKVGKRLVYGVVRYKRDSDSPVVRTPGLDCLFYILARELFGECSLGQRRCFRIGGEAQRYQLIYGEIRNARA